MVVVVGLRLFSQLTYEAPRTHVPTSSGPITTYKPPTPKPEPRPTPPRVVIAPKPKRQQTIPDTSFVYQLPYAKNVAYLVYQGFMTQSTHKDLHALDIAMPEGTPILAARGGVVVYNETDSWFKTMGIEREIENRDLSSGIVIAHEDDTAAMYGHIKMGSAIVSEGDTVRAGQQIGECGRAGSAHLHFHVKLRSNNRTFEWRWATKEQSRFLE